MSQQEFLFDLPSYLNQSEEPTCGKPRLKSPQRMQTEFKIAALDDLIPDSHVARTIWEFVCRLDLSNFLSKFKAVEGGFGRPSNDPRIHLALWILATNEGIGSARNLERYCKEHHAFIWMCGGVSVNYHSLSDFRNQGDELEGLLTQIVASLIQQGVISTESWAQDGMRVRANAGTGSFRREETLQQSIETAEERLQQLKDNAHRETQQLSNRQKAAQERAALERIDKTKKALETLKELHKDIDKRNRSKEEKQKLKKNARASMTDPEARKMKMPNGGYNPAYNVQYATDTHSRIITGVQTVTAGNDSTLMTPMVEYIHKTYGLVPDNWLVDGGFVSEAGLLDSEKLGTEVLMPVPDRSREKHGVEGPLQENSTVMARWVERMETEEAKELYKSRCSSAEFSNASTRNKGFYQFGVRGSLKTHATSILFALTHNIQRITSMIKLGHEIQLSF